jgi:FAD:protein FMN transferase
LWDIWSKAALQKSQPSPLDIQRARKRVNWRAVHVAPDSVNLQIAGMGLSLNGIAQGYAADRVRATLQAHGVHHALIDAGETALLGNAPNDKPWSLGIESSALLKISGTKNSLQPGLISKEIAGPIVISDGRAMATSSDAHMTFSEDHRYHHILNPHSGYSPVHWSSVTVIASSCVVADALTKVFFMTRKDRIMAQALQWGVDVVMQDKAGKWLASSGAPLREPLA